MTPLIYACDNDHEEIVQLLLAANANPNVEDDDGWTPLMYASHKGFQQLVQTLLKVGADPNTKDDEGWAVWRQNNKNENYI